MFLAHQATRPWVMEAVCFWEGGARVYIDGFGVIGKGRDRVNRLMASLLGQKRRRSVMGIELDGERFARGMPAGVQRVRRGLQAVADATGLRANLESAWGPWTASRTYNCTSTLVFRPSVYKFVGVLLNDGFCVEKIPN